MISKSPYKDSYEIKNDEEVEKNNINNFVNNARKNVIIAGLGFVGAAMAAAVSIAKNDNGQLLYNVIGIDLCDEKNYWKIGRVNAGLSPVVSADKSIDNIYEKSHDNQNLMATFSNYAYEVADIVVIDINLDIKKSNLGEVNNYTFSYDIFGNAIRQIAQNISEETLIVVETTVPPGTTIKYIYPIFKEIFKQRNLDINKIYLSHSYERVMPGIQYLSSINNYFRVYSGINNESRKRAKDFLSSFINITDYPLYELHSTTASEMAKVLENSYRAVNIAFIQEWTEFADNANVDLFEVIKAIAVRPTHKNIMKPGFGVGGYCLTKDSLLADWANSNFFEGESPLHMSINSVAINDLMPNYTFSILKKIFKSLKDIKICILGVSYLHDVADTRYTPTEYFYNKCLSEGAEIYLHDSFVSYWDEKKIIVENDLSTFKDKGIDVAIFTVQHSSYKKLSGDDIYRILPAVRCIVDANNVIRDDVAYQLKKNNIHVVGVGKGHWNDLEVK